MGREVTGTARVGKNVSRGTILLETSEVIFRGDFRLKVPFAEMKSVKATNGTLEIRYGSETARFELGPQAEVWAHKILHPPSLLDKLGVKPGMSIAILSVADKEFESSLGKLDLNLAHEKVPPGSDFIFLGAADKAGLKRIAPLTRSIKPAGAIWVVYPKGRKEITENNVLAAGRAAGLKDVKVCSFSPTHTALKFVIPVARRG